MKFYFHSIFIENFNEKPMKNYQWKFHEKQFHGEFFIGFSLNFPIWK